MSSLARPSCLCPAAWKYTRRRCILRTLSCISTSLLSSAAGRPTANFGSCRPPPWPATINNISNLAFQHSNLARSPHAHAAVSGGRRNSRDIVQESTVQLVPLSVSFHSTVRYSYPSIINGDTLSTGLVFSGDRLRHNLANRKGQAVIGRELTHSRLA